jgi:HTH-type transcriptional regulator/antitoxin HipB
MTAFILHTPAQLSAHLRSLRKSRSLTQAQLGALVGLDQTRIAKIERNPGSVSVDQLLKILFALGTQVLLEDGTKPPTARTSKSADW